MYHRGVKSMIDRINSILRTIKASALFQPQNRWILRTGLVIVGLGLCVFSYHYMSQGWADGYSASRTKGGDYSLIFMFPMDAIRGMVYAIIFSAGYVSMIYAITLPRVKPKSDASD